MTKLALGDILSEQERSDNKEDLLNKTGKSILDTAHTIGSMVDNILEKVGLGKISEELINGISYESITALPSRMTGLFLETKALQKLKEEYHNTLSTNKQKEETLSYDVIQNILDKYSGNEDAYTLLTEASAQGITNLDELAYILTTAEHETGNFKHTKEIQGTHNKDKDYRCEDDTYGKIYCGRGYVQLTRKENYQKMQKHIEGSGRFPNINIIKEPELLETNKELSAFVTVTGMRLGLFTGKKLSDYVSDGSFDAEGARAIVNGSDKKAHVATMREKEKEHMLT